MATEVDICNTALSLLGCRADIASISPVEGGRFAEVCAREYQIARNLVLEAHDWSFACRRANLAVLRTDLFGWQFGYVRPADAVSIVAVVPEDDRYFEHPHEFIVEADQESGVPLILTDLPGAVCRYLARVTNTSLFPEHFCQAVAFKLAIRLSGNIIKGTPGQQVAVNLEKQYQTILAAAVHFDMKQRRKDLDLRATWTKKRGLRV